MRGLSNAGAAAPGPVTLTSDKADAANVGQVESQAQSVSFNCPARRAPDQARRSIKNLIVLAALWGFPAAWATWLLNRTGLTHA